MVATHGQSGAHSWVCGEVLLWWMVVSNSFIHMIIYIKRTRYRYRNHGQGRHKGVLASIIIENMITYRTCVPSNVCVHEFRRSWVLEFRRSWAGASVLWVRCEVCLQADWVDIAVPRRASQSLVCGRLTSCSQSRVVGDTCWIEGSVL